MVSQRIIYDAIALSGIAVADFQITPELQLSCSHAYGRYNAYLYEQKEELQKQASQRKRAAGDSELHEAKKKLKILEQTVESLVKDADKQALQAENKSNFALLAKSNALRQKAKEMEENDIEKQKAVICKLSSALV